MLVQQKKGGIPSDWLGDSCGLFDVLEWISCCLPWVALCVESCGTNVSLSPSSGPDESWE